MARIMWPSHWFEFEAPALKKVIKFGLRGCKRRNSFSRSFTFYDDDGGGDDAGSIYQPNNDEYLFLCEMIRSIATFFVVFRRSWLRLFSFDLTMWFVIVLRFVAKTDHFDVVLYVRCKKKRVFILRKPLLLFVSVSSDFSNAPSITILVKHC